LKPRPPVGIRSLSGAAAPASPLMGFETRRETRHLIHLAHELQHPPPR